MKVTKDMIHRDLRSKLFVFKVLAVFCKFKSTTRFLDYVFSFTNGKNEEGLKCEEIYIPSNDGSHQIRVRIYRPLNSEGPLPAMLYMHGGGYVFGNPEAAGEFIREIITRRPCVIVAPAYRTAYKKPYPAAFSDSYDTLLWLKDNAASLGTSGQIMVAGHSAGGGLTAAVTLKARDTGDVNIAFQIPLYPMIDDRQPDDPDRAMDTFGWDTECNRVAWNAYLADLKKQGAEIPLYAAPARNTNYQGLPPTITFVGDMEPFYWETIAYVDGLKETGTDVAFELYEGCYHAFEDTVPDSEICQTANGFLFDSYERFYDKYILSA